MAKRYKKGEQCPVCGGKVPIARNRVDKNNRFWCSKKCQSKAEGFSKGYARILTKWQQVVDDTKTFRGDAQDPIINVNSKSPITIGGDMHVPIHDPRWVKQMMAVSKALDSRVLILNGDFLNLDGLGRHVDSHWRRRQCVEDDFAAGERLLDLFAHHYERVYIVAGNHCNDRLQKIFRGEVPNSRLWALLNINDKKNIFTTEYSYVIVNNCFYVGHPREYRKQPGSLGKAFMEKYNMNVLLAHQHHLSMMMINGFWVVDGGCLILSHDASYIQKSFNSFPNPVNGFYTLHGCTPKMWSAKSDFESIGAENFVRGKNE